ncbi:hypothetical protein Bbelb_122370 [Branchiostoma belcheri]|nr:hypothetical protein Bbelb_122370 [Branchiostoma belcheri]
MPEPYYGEAELLGWSNRSYKRRRERQRVAELNAALSRLKRLVPSVGILRAAVDYIRDMREKLGTLQDTMQEGRPEEDSLWTKLTPIRTENGTDHALTPSRLTGE